MEQESAKNDQEFKRLGNLLISRGSDALLGELKRLTSWSENDLSQLLVYLAVLGGTKWPTELYSMGANLNFVDNEGQTALSQCVHGFVTDEVGNQGNSTLETAIEILALGADPNSTYLSMFSVTLLAANWNLPQFVSLFILAGADLDGHEPDSQTSDTLRQAILKANTLQPKLQGQSWPHQLVSILDRQKSAKGW